MPSHSWPGPRRSVEAIGAQRGREVVVQACIDLLAGREVEGALLHALGGPPARWAVVGGEPGPDYWPRVWALRGLLWLWGATATQAVVAALSDDAWRVREMAAKVAARHELDDAINALLLLREDRIARVRAAAARAVQQITIAGE